MVRALSVVEMREADRRCIEELGIPGAVLMENAGRAVFAEIAEGPVGIVCGKGNNGGDGFVVARHALLSGMEPRLILAADPDDLRGDAATFMNAYRHLGGVVTVVREAADWDRDRSMLDDCAVVVDALLGTGAQGAPRGVLRDIIEGWPSIGTIAVDVPSGLNADTGEVAGACVRADTTVTFQFTKRGFRNPAAAPFLGRLVIADIGIPEVCADDEAWGRLTGGS